MKMKVGAALAIVAILGACTTSPNEGGAAREATPEPAPSPEPTRTPPPEIDPLPGSQLVAVFASAGADSPGLHAMYGDGRTETLASIPGNNRYLHPGFVQPIYQQSGKAVVVERTRRRSSNSRLVYVNLTSGEEVPLGGGSLPSVDSPTNSIRIAFFVHGKAHTLVIADIGSDYINNFELDAPAGVVTWDRDARFVFVLTDEAAPRLLSYDSTGELAETEIHSKNETVFVAVTSDEMDSAVVLQACCTAGPIDGAALTNWELGHIEGTSTGEPKYRSLVPVDDLGLSSEGLAAGDLRLTPAGTLDASVDDSGTITWGRGDERAWILGSDDGSWLIDEDGDIVDLGEFGTGGVAISPRLLR